MYSLERDNDTICALSTPAGVGAIAVVRLSGANAVAVARRLAPFIKNQIESHKVYYGHLLHPTTGETLDEVLLTYFAKGKSFTGEDTIEFSCHGSPAIAQEILQSLVIAGARMAQRGEFTYRAFSHGRIDLVQAESVLSLIESQSALTSRVALRQLQGNLSQQIAIIEDHLTWCLSRLEANIDFSSEAIEFAPRNEIINRLKKAIELLNQMISSYQFGKVLRNGLKVAIVGAPNVGKSSIMNRLAGFERSIVSAVAGTTRDTVETAIDISSQKITLVDTAGMRETENEIERLGVQRSSEAIQDADLIFFIKDLSDPNTWAKPEELKSVRAPVVTIGNKLDLYNSPIENSDEIFVSANTAFGIDRIISIISEFISASDADNSSIVLQTRQFELLQRAVNGAQNGLSLMVDDLSPEFVISELQLSLEAIFELLGRKFDDEVLDRVFREFCLGK